MPEIRAVYFVDGVKVRDTKVECENWAVDPLVDASSDALTRRDGLKTRRDAHVLDEAKKQKPQRGTRKVSEKKPVAESVEVEAEETHQKARVR